MTALMGNQDSPNQTRDWNPEPKSCDDVMVGADQLMRFSVALRSRTFVPTDESLCDVNRSGRG